MTFLLRRRLSTRRTNAETVSQRYAELWESIGSLLLAGGKRIRPHLLLTAYMGYEDGGEVEDVLSAALSQEILHSAMLIHDDIIDRDDTRYGVKNISGQYKNIYAPHIADKQERAHMSLSAAILAGDILLSDAHRLLRHTDRPQERVDKASEILSNAVFEVVGGELLDTEVSFLPVGIISAETIAQYKTASYSFTSPLTIGAVLAGAPESELELLRELSQKLGVGYQMRDDILGVFGDEAKTGKSASTDITEGKRTFLIEQFEMLATPAQSQRFLQIFHRPDATEQELEEARELLVEAGAKSAVEQQIDSLRDAAYELIAQLGMNKPAKAEIYLIAKKCLQRDI